MGSLYERARAAGDLWLYSGRLTPVAPFLARVRRELAGEPVQAIGCDRFRYKELTEHLRALGIRWRTVWRGSGVRAAEDTQNDIRCFQRTVEGDRLRTAPNLLMLHAHGTATLVRDGDGHPVRIVPARAKARIDALIASVTAVGLAGRRQPNRGGRVWVA